ncbi:MAG: DNA repair protein RecO [Patescibacteria group bacterium]
MSYNIYTTRGLVLSARPLREADRLYSVLTKDLGLIYARALGVRKEASKLRGNLEPFSLVHVSLVRGQVQWRVTSASLIAPASVFDHKKSMLRSLVRGFSLLERLVQGEEKHPELFEAVEEVFNFALSDEAVAGSEEPLEMILVARLLHHLGYLSSKDIPEEILCGELHQEHLVKARENKKKLIEVINHGLLNTDLT